MNKAALIDMVYEQQGGTRQQATETVEMIFGAIVDTVAKGQEVNVAQFGIFEARKRAARAGRNPRTGETIQIAASRAAKFRPAAAFKNAVK